MKRAPRSRQRHDLYAKYHDYDSEISDLLGECGIQGELLDIATHDSPLARRASDHLPIRARLRLAPQTVGGL